MVESSNNFKTNVCYKEFFVDIVQISILLISFRFDCDIEERGFFLLNGHFNFILLLQSNVRSHGEENDFT